eukprot:c18150_g1_i2 orf=140-601(+)
MKSEGRRNAAARKKGSARAHTKTLTHTAGTVTQLWAIKKSPSTRRGREREIHRPRPQPTCGIRPAFKNRAKPTSNKRRVKNPRSKIEDPHSFSSHRGLALPPPPPPSPPLFGKRCLGPSHFAPLSFPLLCVYIPPPLGKDGCISGCSRLGTPH